MRDYETDRVSLIHVIADLMKRLPVGQEVVIPPEVARSLEDFSSVHEGGIAIMITPSSAKNSTSAMASWSGSNLSDFIRSHLLSLMPPFK